MIRSTGAGFICFRDHPGVATEKRRVRRKRDLRSMEKEMATHSSILAWRIPGTEEPSGLPSMGLHRVGQDWSDLAAAAVVQYMMNNKTLALQQCIPVSSYHLGNKQCSLSSFLLFYKIVLLRYYVFSVFTALHNHHQNLTVKHFHLPPKNLTPIRCPSPCPTPTLSPQP